MLCSWSIKYYGSAAVRNIYLEVVLEYSNRVNFPPLLPRTTCKDVQQSEDSFSCSTEVVDQHHHVNIFSEYRPLRKAVCTYN